MKTSREMEMEYIQNPDLEEHHVEDHCGRLTYPFKDMDVGDYFLMENEDIAKKTRAAVQYWYRENPTTRFYVLRRELSEWVCRRIM